MTVAVLSPTRLRLHLPDFDDFVGSRSDVATKGLQSVKLGIYL